MTRTNITGKQFDEERALYHLQNADVKGHIISVKNPRSGHIIADSVGEIIRGDAVMECTGEVILRAETEKKAESVSEASKDIA